MIKFEQYARRACEGIFGSTVLRTVPAGRAKSVSRLFLEDGRSLIATRRPADRARLEFHVLQSLRSQGANVPEVLAFDGRLLFQEDLGRKRMSLVLKKVTRARGEKLLSLGLTSLADIHARARNAGLENLVAPLGEGEDWLRFLIDRPRVLGEFLQLPVPALPVDKLVELLRVRATSFVKWDARPPNAVVFGKGQIGWVDWENCGRRNRLDDLAWYFGDQSVPEWPDAEERLLLRHVPDFTDNMSLDEAHDYIAVFGTLHMCVRITQILNREKKRGVEGWGRDIADDVMGQKAQTNALKLVTRASRWAGRSTLLGSLSLWLAEVALVLGSPEPTT